MGLAWNQKNLLIFKYLLMIIIICQPFWKLYILFGVLGLLRNQSLPNYQMIELCYQGGVVLVLELVVYIEVVIMRAVEAVIALVDIYHLLPNAQVKMNHIKMIGNFRFKKN